MNNLDKNAHVNEGFEVEGDASYTGDLGACDSVRDFEPETGECGSVRCQLAPILEKYEMPDFFGTPDTIEVARQMVISKLMDQFLNERKEVTDLTNEHRKIIETMLVRFVDRYLANYELEEDKREALTRLDKFDFDRLFTESWRSHFQGSVHKNAFTDYNSFRVWRDEALLDFELSKIELFLRLIDGNRVPFSNGFLKEQSNLAHIIQSFNSHDTAFKINWCSWAPELSGVMQAYLRYLGPGYCNEKFFDDNDKEIRTGLSYYSIKEADRPILEKAYHQTLSFIQEITGEEYDELDLLKNDVKLGYDAEMAVDSRVTYQLPDFNEYSYDVEAQREMAIEKALDQIVNDPSNSFTNEKKIVSLRGYLEQFLDRLLDLVDNESEKRQIIEFFTTHYKTWREGGNFNTAYGSNYAPVDYVDVVFANSNYDHVWTVDSHKKDEVKLVYLLEMCRLYLISLAQNSENVYIGHTMDTFAKAIASLEKLRADKNNETIVTDLESTHYGPYIKIILNSEYVSFLGELQAYYLMRGQAVPDEILRYLTFEDERTGLYTNSLDPNDEKRKLIEEGFRKTMEKYGKEDDKRLEVVRSKQRINELSEKNAALQSSVEDLETRLEVSQTENEEISAQKNVLEARTSELTTNLTEADQQIAKMREMIESAIGTLEDHKFGNRGAKIEAALETLRNVMKDHE
ncbi:hypothetical protein GF354_01780 [Candidatus Peregrinibacteria bacterium]|nr:hypothetical protein [Candidatus Peregrinibacteria bacterium]